MRIARSMLLVAACAAAAQDPPPEPAPASEGPRDIRQVQIQVWISETNETGIRDVGTNLNFTRFIDGVENETGSLQQVTTSVFDPQGDFPGVTLPSPTAPAGAIPGDFNTSLRDPDDESSAAGIQTRGGVGLTGSVITDRGTIDAVFRSVERNADVDLISKPELLVVNNGTASIKAGGNVPFQDVEYDKNGIPQLNVDFQDTGVNLTLVPSIQPNDFIRLTLTELDVTDIDRIENIRGIDLPVFSKRSQTGVVLVPNQQTLVIGGLSSRVVRSSTRQVPFLGSIPLLGLPFRSKASEADITHLLVFVSPTIVDLRDLNKRQRSALEFWQESGDKWDHADRIEQEVELMETEL